MKNIVTTADTTEELYTLLKARGWHIDVRGANPLLIKGVTAISFPSYSAALTYGLTFTD